MAACPLRLNLKIVYQVFHTNAAGQESRSFGFHQCESAFASIIDSHYPLEINDKVALGMSVAGFLPMGPKVRNPRVSEPPLENKPLLGVSVDSCDLQHRFHLFVSFRVSSPPQQLAQADPPLGQE